mmetsp:Transcript_27389/g.63233  ORF Transcript_27389/g.63233 Transcript_27389/m.63233 type:complete len:423 (+) Transcript_27389:97-1365(+)
MSEFRKAAAALEEAAAVVERLASTPAEVADVGGEIYQSYVDARRQMGELQPVIEKMKIKCKARADLDVAKDELRAKLPPAVAASEDLTTAAKEFIDSSDAGPGVAVSLDPLLNRALELEAVATYGPKMVDKVVELLAKFDVVNARYNAEVVLRFSNVIAVAEQQAAEVRKSMEDAAAREALRAAEEARKPVDRLLLQSEQKMEQMKHEAEAAERAEREREESLRLLEEQTRAELEALRREEEADERRLRDFGPDGACSAALVTMLGLSVGGYRDVVTGLAAILGSIAAEPADLRRRVIRLANEDFQTKLGRQLGVMLFLRGIGFKVHLREALAPTIVAALSLPAAPLAEPFLVLPEPDMMRSFEEWTEWHSRLTRAASFMEELNSLVFQRTASLGRHGLDSAASGAVSGSEVTARWEAALRA